MYCNIGCCNDLHRQIFRRSEGVVPGCSLPIPGRVEVISPENREKIRFIAQSVSPAGTFGGCGVNRESYSLECYKCHINQGIAIFLRAFVPVLLLSQLR